MQRVLGVDGGNSKTLALVSGLDGRLLGFAVDRETRRANVRATLPAELSG